MYNTKNQIRKSYQGSEIFNRDFPVGTIGYGCKIKSVEYDGETLSMYVNSGLPERNLKLKGIAAQKFLEDMEIKKISDLNKRAVSVFYNPKQGIERIARRDA